MSRDEENWLLSLIRTELTKAEKNTLLKNPNMMYCTYLPETGKFGCFKCNEVAVPNDDGTIKCPKCDKTLIYA